VKSQQCQPTPSTPIYTQKVFFEKKLKKGIKNFLALVTTIEKPFPLPVLIISLHKTKKRKRISNKKKRNFPANFFPYNERKI
jgi:hypothetical protein